MRKQILSCLFFSTVIALALMFPHLVWAKANPLRSIVGFNVRPEIMLVFDTSGSMTQSVSSGTSGYGDGQDCSGGQANVDICGDRMCSGQESNSSCNTDCTVLSKSTCDSSYTCYLFKKGGSTQPCVNAKKASRNFMLKRALRNILPALNSSANFGLITFQETGYFTYYKAAGTAYAETTVFFTQTELRNISGWNATTDAPLGSFTYDPINQTETWTGAALTLVSNKGYTNKTTSAALTEDSLYRRQDNYSEEKRFAFATAGLGYAEPSTGYVWEYVGSYYTFNMYDPAYANVTTTSSTYNGPQYKDSSGVIWIYRPLVGVDGNMNSTYQGYDYTNKALTLESIDPVQSQTAQTAKMASIMRWMNTSSNGGIVPDGSTPTGDALTLAKDYFVARAKTDPGVACRKRYILVITDGLSNTGANPTTMAGTIYGLFPSNRITVSAISVPGLADTSEVKSIASAGGGTAYYATNETQLVKSIQDALLSMVGGEYATAPAGTATSGNDLSTTGDYSLVSSAKIPEWYGQFRAYNLLTATPTLAWDAGLKLETEDYRNRKLFTSNPNDPLGYPMPLFYGVGTASASVNTSALLPIWQASFTAAGLSTAPATVVNIKATVEWLAGRPNTATVTYPAAATKKLGPIFRSTPAVVGPPPKYSTNGHAAYELKYAKRQRIAYTAANNGILHAFNMKDGKEMFGYVPPNLWPKIYQLYTQGGQSKDTSKFLWILANSPRVEDVPPTGTITEWRTILVQTMGPGDENFVVLDVTSPTDCTNGTCVTNTIPFKVIGYSPNISGLTTTVGETWSIPAIYYETSGTNLVWRASMGSGYGVSGYAATEGTYYNYFETPWSTFSTYALSPVSQLTGVEYALLANSAAAIMEPGNPEVVAVYQADLNGRLFRYPKGTVKGVNGDFLSTGASASTPFYYAPAVYRKKDGNIILSMVSGSIDEEATLPESVIFLRRESNGTIVPSLDSLTCRVSQICTTACFPAGVPTGCTAPLSTAQPMSSPLIVDNATSGLVESFYTLFEPPPSTDPCAYGDSWILRVSTSSTGAMKLLKATEIKDTRIAGLTIAGGGKGVVAITSSKGSPTGVTQVAGGVTAGTPTTGAAYFESWREVR